MTDPERWPSDYFDSRDRFAELARAGGARTGTRSVGTPGPGGEPLSVDTAAFGPSRPEHLIVITGGVHGVEGFLGAAVQAEVLRRLAEEGLPHGVGVVLIHAVNPWGFAHLRRVDERNVDVNRNFLDPTLPRPPAPVGYAALDPLINPRGAPGRFDEVAFWLRASRLIVRARGLAPLAGAIAEGQDRFPKGLFFGGTEIGESSRTLQELLLEHASGAGRVTHLDLHSGLGPSATATLIGNSDVGSPRGRAERLRAHYRQPIVLDDAPGAAYDARGTLCRWFRRSLGETPWLYLCVEIGTVNPLRVLSALRRENRAHHWVTPGAKAYADAKHALLEVFSPRSRRWREGSVAEALHTFERTLDLPLDPGEADL